MTEQEQSIEQVEAAEKRDELYEFFLQPDGLFDMLIRMNQVSEETLSSKETVSALVYWVGRYREWQEQNEKKEEQKRIEDAPYETSEKSDYFENFMTPAFVKMFGRNGEAVSYLMSADHETMMFNVNSPTLFVQEEFGNVEFRERLKKSLQDQPKEVNKQLQMKIEFECGERSSVSGCSYETKVLINVIHILHEDNLHVYPFHLKDDIDNPLLVSDGWGHFVIIAPVSIKSIHNEEEDSVQTEAVEQAEKGEDSHVHAFEDTRQQTSNIERHKQIIQSRSDGKTFSYIEKQLGVARSSAHYEVTKHANHKCSCSLP